MTDQAEKLDKTKETALDSKVREASEVETQEAGLHNEENKKIHDQTQARHKIGHSATDLMIPNQAQQGASLEMVDEEGGYVLTGKGYKPLVPDDISKSFGEKLRAIPEVNDPALLPDKVADATIEYWQAKGMIPDSSTSLEDLQEQCGYNPEDPNNGSDSLPAMTEDEATYYRVHKQPGHTMLEGGIQERHKVDEPPPANFMAALSPEMRAGVIAAFQKGGQVGQQTIHETTDDILRKTAEGYIDTIKAPIDVAIAAGKGLWGILEFERDLITNPERAQQTAATAGDYIGKALVAGIKLWGAGSEYAADMQQKGDYGRPFQDLGNAINKWYDSLTPGDQMHAMATVSAGFGLGAAAGQLRQLAKPGAFVQFLEEAAQAVPKNPEAQAKATESVKKLIQAMSSTQPGLQPALAGEAAILGGPKAPGLIDQVKDVGKGLKNKWDELVHKMEPHKPGNDGAFRHTNPIDRTASTSEKVRELRRLSKENEPLVKGLTESIDSKYGTKSQISFKQPADIADKASRPSIKADKPWFDVEHIRDALRFKTPVDDLRLLPRIIDDLLESQFEIINPDFEKLLTPKARGWRMAAIDLKAPNGQIIEFQILPREMNEAGKIEHQMYKAVRGKDPAKLSHDEKVELLKVDKAARNLYQEAWTNYLARTGQTEADIRKFIETAIAKITK